MFCRVVLRFSPIVLSSVESRFTLLRCTVRESWFPSCSSLFVCSAESCSSPCRVQVSPTKCNRGRWPLLWPFRSCRHRSCRCSISGNYRTRSRLPHLSPESLRTQTAVRHRRFLCPFEETVASVWNCIYIFISIIKTILNIYLNAGRSVQLFHRRALRGFFTDSLVTL